MTKNIKRSVIYMAALLLSLTACQSDLTDPDSRAGVIDSDRTIGQQVAGDSVYVRLQFNVPARRQGTRSGLTGTTDTGSDDEYAFHDGILVIFEAAADEDYARLNSAYYIPNLSAYSDSYENLKTAVCTVAISRDKVAELTVKQLRALVIMNPCGQFTVSDDELCHDGEKVAANTTFDEVKSLVCDDFGDGTRGFFMTNAPMLTKGRGSDEAQVKTLAEVSMLFFTAEKAAAAAEAETTTVIVERAAVKVTMKLGNSPLQPIYIDDHDEYEWRVALDEANVTWTIDNYNRAFYMVRHARPTWNTIKASYTDAVCRFVYPVQTEGLYRSQWGEDINYSNYTGNHSGTTGTDSWNDTDAPRYEHLSGVCQAADITHPCTKKGHTLYVAENTVSERCLTWYNTTRVVVRAPLKGTHMPQRFFVLGVNGMNHIYSYTTDTDFESKVLAHLATWYDEQASDYPELAELSSRNGADIFNDGVTKISIDGATQAFTFAFEKSGFNADEQTALDKMLVLLNTTNYKFSEPVMYYASYIAHFGSQDTPWNQETHAPFSTKLTDTYANTYYEGGTDDTHLVQNFFGRWSIVRDHWYQLTLHTISHAGTPTVPDPPKDTPDDQVNNPVTIVPGFPINYIGETPQW